MTALTWRLTELSVPTETEAGFIVESDLFEKVGFEKLKKMISETLGLNCEGYREDYVRRRFNIRLKETGTKTYSAYVNYLKKNPAEFKMLLRDLTVNYTTFFRDTEVFSYLERNIFPALFVQPTVKIWSAGCSTGEEPYTLAILASKLLEHHPYKGKVTIFASDIDREALATAAEGVYAASQLAGAPNWMLTRYFSKVGDKFKVKDSIKEFVKFDVCDLMKPSPRQNLDLVLCRNVMIYFTREGQQRVHMNFFDALRPGGYFVAGKTEMLSGEPAARFKMIDVQSRVYVKPLK
jgi:chemotaxis protein methyltransferase CheR